MWKLDVLVKKLGRMYDKHCKEVVSVEQDMNESTKIVVTKFR